MAHRYRTLMRRVVRRAWIVVVCLVLAGAIGAVGRSSQTTTWSSTTTLLVPSVIGQAYDAQRQAATYAALLPLDDAVLTAVARRTGLSVGQVGGGLVVTNVQNTSLIAVTFRAGSAALATAGVTAFSNAVSGSHPASTAIQPGTLQVFNAPSAPYPSRGGTQLMSIALLLGAIVGIVIAVAVDRADLRADTVDVVERVLGCPASDLATTSSAGLTALVERWRSLGPPGRKIALLPAERTGVAAAGTAVAALKAAAGETVATVNGAAPATANGFHRVPGLFERATAVEDSDEPPAIRLVPVRDATRADLAAVRADDVVLVIAAGSRLRRAEEAVQRLAALGREPLWCLVVPRHESAQPAAPRSVPSTDGAETQPRDRTKVPSNVTTKGQREPLAQTQGESEPGTSAQVQAPPTSSSAQSLFVQ